LARVVGDIAAIAAVPAITDQQASIAAVAAETAISSAG
jgi:hypothetical protein